MEKIWLKHYPPQVPAEINPDVYTSIVELFETNCKNYKNKPAFYNMGVTLAYTEIDEYSRAFAAYLQQHLHLKKGDRFAIMLPNCLQYPIAMLGALRAGLIVVNVNPLYTADELTLQLNDAGATGILAFEAMAHTVQHALPRVPSLKNIIVTSMGDMFPFFKRHIVNFVLKYVHKKIPNFSLPNAHAFKRALAQGKKLSLAPVLLKNSDVAFLQYTGGTTGIAKGAMLTHRNIIANLQQSGAWLGAQPVKEKEIIITALPLYHIFSLLVNCLLYNKFGALNVLITNPRDIKSMIKTMRQFKFTAITGVNTLFNALLNHPDFSKLDFSELRFTIGGGMAVQKAVADKWQAATNKPILEGYGLSETSPCVSMNVVTATHFNGTIGLPLPSTDICIFDENGCEVGIGHAGELAVKGPQVMKGYWQNPVESENAFTSDHWFLTGDIASVDEEGQIRILERKKDMILVSGFNVYPNEIENIIAKHPSVREVAVVGVSDEHSGEAVKAFIVHNHITSTRDEIISHCRKHLTSYKIPKHIEFCADLPKTNVGKILRRALKVPVQQI